MTAITDFTTVLEILIGRPLAGNQLASIGASFVKQDPYQKGGWSDTEYNLVAADVADGGTGYAVDDILTVVGGTGTAATARVTAETGGVIDALSIETEGAYSVPPSNPISLSGGTGAGATATGIGGSYQVPRAPTNEETAQLGLDTFAEFGKILHMEAKGGDARTAEEANIDALVEAARQAALADLT